VNLAMILVKILDEIMMKSEQDRSDSGRIRLYLFGILRYRVFLCRWIVAVTTISDDRIRL